MPHRARSPVRRTPSGLLKKEAAARRGPTWNLTSRQKTRIISVLGKPMDTVLKIIPEREASPELTRRRDQALALYALPFNDLLFQAHTAHRENFGANRVQRSTLLSIKTGGCPED